MLIEVKNSYSRVASASDAELRWLGRFLAFENVNARFVAGAPERYCLLTAKKHTFPTGLLPVVRRHAKEHAFTVLVRDLRTVPATYDLSVDTSGLWTHQKEALEVARRIPRGVFHHATGAGKTVLAGAIVQSFPSVPVTLLTDSIDLMHQTASRFEAVLGGETVGRIGDGHWTPRRVTVASTDSLAADLEGGAPKFPYDRTAVLLFDECHKAAARTGYRVTMKFAQAYYRYGFSATPFDRGDKRNLLVVAALGPTIHRASAARLVADGVLAQAHVTLLQVVAPTSGADTWPAAYQEVIARGEVRNRALLDAARTAHKPMILFVRDLAHGKRLADALTRGGTPAEFAWGDKSTSERKAAIRRLEHGDTDVLVCNVIFQEGIDIPRIRTVGHAGGGKSLIVAMQQLGRGSRRMEAGHEIKATFDMLDVLDVPCCAHLPHFQRHKACRWVSSHARKREAAYRDAGYPVRTIPVGAAQFIR